MAHASLPHRYLEDEADRHASGPDLLRSSNWLCRARFGRLAKTAAALAVDKDHFFSFPSAGSSHCFP